MTANTSLPNVVEKRCEEWLEMMLGVGLDGRLGLSFAELSEMGREAARLGFESMWTPATGVPDSFHVCGAWAEESRDVLGTSLRTGISVVPAPRQWNPVSLAVQAATVSVRSGGEFVLGIGSGGAGPEYFAAAGFPNRPIAVMRDYLTILRGLLAGESVTYEGAALSVKNTSIGHAFEPVPVYLAALGPQMLHLAGELADGVCLNWASPEQIAWSRSQLQAGAKAAGRDDKDLLVSMYIRVCIDDDVAAARRALAIQVLGYSLARPGVDKTLSYRGHFGRMGFEDVLLDLEARQEAGATMDELADAAPDEMLRAVGYFGPASEAASAFAELSIGLDESIARIVTARPGTSPVLEAMEALTPAKVRSI
jgi:alkanesulfonate monooxygenase SsuD/methylene tetrahydromethanopterin reductase-like flavin-dependent oxidoreductase (luciferase family)